MVLNVYFIFQICILFGDAIIISNILLVNTLFLFFCVLLFRDE